MMGGSRGKVRGHRPGAELEGWALSFVLPQTLGMATSHFISALASRKE